MNHYGQMARDHWAKYRPREYRAMTGRERFFTDLGERISDQVADLAAALEGQPPPGETFLDRVGRLNMAQLMAREQVLRETLPPAEQDEAT